MISKLGSFVFLVIFSAFATITTQLLWHLFGGLVLFQLLLIFIITSFGENYVSSQGYYHYPRHRRNGPFVREVPIWIIFLWIFLIQGGLVLSIALGLEGFGAASMSGMIVCFFDFLLIEPLLSRYMELWRWTPVKRGYFSFIPAKLNRFTAPPGNYIAWLVFPVLANGFLVFLMNIA